MDLLLTINQMKKLYIKYHLATKLRNNHIYDYIEDLFNVEEVLKDDLVIITKEKVKIIFKIFGYNLKKDGYFINIYNYNDFCVIF